MRALVILLLLFVPARAQVVGLVLDPIESRYCVARSNARPLDLYDVVSIRRGGVEVGQARVVRYHGNVVMLRELSAFDAQRGDQVVYLSAGSAPPSARTNAQARSLQANYGPGPAIPPHYLTSQTVVSSPKGSKASFSGSGGSGG